MIPHKTWQGIVNGEGHFNDYYFFACTGLLWQFCELGKKLKPTTFTNDVEAHEYAACNLTITMAVP